MHDSQKTEKKVGEIIAEARKNTGLSLRAVAAKISINFTYLADIEKDRRQPSEKVLRALSELPELELNFDELMSKAGRLGEKAEIYIKNHPSFGGLVREIVEENLSDAQILEVKNDILNTIRLAKTPTN
jgi:transcriptional regulator with XRE-family HTH domain